MQYLCQPMLFLKESVQIKVHIVEYVTTELRLKSKLVYFQALQYVLLYYQPDNAGKMLMSRLQYNIEFRKKIQGICA